LSHLGCRLPSFRCFELSICCDQCVGYPNIWYNDINGKKHKHYVDIFIPSQNLCIEVKSEWTIKLTTSNVFLKQQAAKEQGYKYEIWVYNKKGIKTNCYQ